MTDLIESETIQPCCLNCDAPLSGNYCSQCGQSASAHRISFKETIKEFFSSTFALEGPLLFTIRSLVVNPGKLIRSFIEGRRKAYYKPVSFFVVLTAIYLIVRSLIGYDPMAGQTQFQAENISEAAQMSIEAGRFMVANINNIMFFLVLAIGLSHKLLFPRKYNLAEYLTAGFFISGMYVLVGLTHMLFSTYVYFISPMTNILVLFGYLLYTSTSIHQSKSPLSIIRYLLISLLSILIYMVMGFGFSLSVVLIRSFLES